MVYYLPFLQVLVRRKLFSLRNTLYTIIYHSDNTEVVCQIKVFRSITSGPQGLGVRRLQGPNNA